MIYRLIETGELPAFKISNRIYIEPKDVAALKESNRVKPRPKTPFYEPPLRPNKRRDDADRHRLRELRERGEAS